MGFIHVLPEAVKDKAVSAVEVGPYDESALAEELNKRFGINITGLAKTESYLMVHPPELAGIEKLLDRTPFVDPIVHRATLNSPLISELSIGFDHVLQGMYRPGTSDAEGDTALKEVLLALGKKPEPGDIGFRSQQYFLKGDLAPAELEAVSAELFNPDLNSRIIVGKTEFDIGRKLVVPVVTLKPNIVVERYQLDITEKEFQKINSDLMLAATFEEWQQFAEMYKNPEFLARRRALGLDERATDVELVKWFGLRSEHCFHKEFNAHITLEDKVEDPIFRRAFEKGWLKKDAIGNYVLEKGMFKTFVEEPAEAIFEKLEKRGKNWIASMFSDNSGVVYYNEDYMFCIKFETHNSPSNKEPVQGAKTGIDGVNRDVFGTMLGTFDAIANFFWYNTGNPGYKGWLPKGVKWPYTILKGITRGVREGGNEMQIATLGGGASFDPRYIAKCLVHCGTIGWSPVRSADGRSFIEKNPRAGDIVLVAGQAVGIDGIGGATQSSLSASAEISLGHVQADFSFIQAKMKEYLLDVSRNLLLSDITDCGAMGISAADELCRAGLIMDMGAHPQKYMGIWPRDIARSETQDRMVLRVTPKNLDAVLEKARLHDVPVTPIGEATDSGFLQFKYGNETVGLIESERMFSKEPRKYMHATWAQKNEEIAPVVSKKHTLEESLCLVMGQPDVASKEWFFRQKDSSVKGATIQGPLIGLKQEVEADTTIQKPLDTEGKDFGAIAYAMGIAPKVSDLDPYHSAQKSFIDMAGKIIAVGGALPDMENAKLDAWAVCGNFCQPNSEGKTTLVKESGEHNLASLVREGIGIREAVEATNIPVISGKDSMKCSCVYDIDLEPFAESHDSEFAREFMALEEDVRKDLDKVREAMGSRFDSDLLDDMILSGMPADVRRHIALAERKRKLKRKAVVEGKEVEKEYEVMGKAIEIHDPDSYLASAAVKIEDYRKCVNSAFKREGDIIYIVGTTRDQLGASQYLSAVGYDEQGAPIEGGKCPEANLDEFVKIAGVVHKAIDKETVASCSYIHNGGLAAAVAKAAMAGEKGADISTEGMFNAGCSTDEELLYSETAGRFIVTVAPQDQERFEDIIGLMPCSRIGTVTSEGTLKISKMDKTVEEISQAKVKKAYQAPLSFGMMRAA